MHNLKKYKGLQIDLFPCDDKVNSKLQLLFSKGNIARGYLNKFGVKKLNYLIALILFSTENLLCKLFRTLTPRKSYVTQTYGMIFYGGKSHSKNDIYPLREIPFEGHLFYVPNNVDSVLKDYYGDYMQIPDESELNGHNVSEIKMW